MVRHPVRAIRDRKHVPAVQKVLLLKAGKCLSREDFQRGALKTTFQ
jgi:hypothetical protein